MGLDFTHTDAHWSYSGFMRARERLAETMGLNLREMVGFAGLAEHGAREWPSADEYPLVYLLHHSDCDGELTPEQCKAVAPALRKAVDGWPQDDYDRINFLELADGMDAAAADNEPLEFY